MRLGFGEILVVLALALLFFGPSKLPALGASLGEAIRGFKHGLTSVGSEPEGPPSSQRAGNEATGSSQSTVGIGDSAEVCFAFQRARPIRRTSFSKRRSERRGSKPGRSRTLGLNRASYSFSSQFMA